MAHIKNYEWLPNGRLTITWRSPVLNLPLGPETWERSVEGNWVRVGYFTEPSHAKLEVLESLWRERREQEDD